PATAAVGIGTGQRRRAGIARIEPVLETGRGGRTVPRHRELAVAVVSGIRHAARTRGAAAGKRSDDEVVVARDVAGWNHDHRAGRSAFGGALRVRLAGAPVGLVAAADATVH